MPTGPTSLHFVSPHRFLVRAAMLLAVGLCSPAVVGQVGQTESDQPLPLREFLILPRVGQYGRTLIHVDPIQAALARGEWRIPEAGSTVAGAEAYAAEWREASADADGWLRSSALRGGYAFTQVEWPRDEVLLLEAVGDAMVYVNGEPRAGDPYETGQTVLPVQMHEGINTFLFHVARGELRASLVRPAQPVSIDLRDATLPDLVAGETGTRWVGVLVINARSEPLEGCRCAATRAGAEALTTALPTIPPCSVRKVAVPFDGDVTSTEASAQAIRLQIDLIDDSAPEQKRVLATAAFDLAVVAPDAPQTRTFLSQVDGSVQSYALLLAANDMAANTQESAPGLVVSLHDVGVSAAEHLARCKPLDWAHVLAPNGRRPHGFDWEDWSARDVDEAIADLRRHVRLDPAKLWLTGTGTGGHGVWHLATTEPGHWAAVAPRDAWVSYQTFGGGLPAFSEPTPVEEMLLRSANTCDTSALVGNLAPSGVYVQHDPNNTLVPVEQSRLMREQLARFHTDFVYHEPRAGQPAASGDCTFSPALAQFFRERQTVPLDKVELVTFDPGTTSTSGWLTIAQQIHPLELSRASLQFDASRRSFAGTTSNVAALAVDLSWLEPGVVDVTLDGESLGPLLWPESSPPQLWFFRTPAGWTPSNPPPSYVKSPMRSGNFKSVFDRRVVLVYGTRGDEAENAWALAKARFDAEQFLTRANGSVEVIPDAEFHPGRYPNRNVVLYGNADTNSAWPSLLSTSPVQVRDGRVRVGVRPESGDDLACVFVRPRTDSDRALVAAVSGTGIAGFRATDRLPYFVSGVTLPDLIVFGSESLSDGVDEIRALGSFGPDWGIDTAEINWRDAAL